MALHYMTHGKKKERRFKEVCTAVSHLGMRSCDRDASLARALIRVVMTLGAAQTAPGAGADEVISNSTASSASKQEVMRLTEQRESHDTDRYSPSTHTWKGNKFSIILVSGFGTFYCWVWYFTIFQCMGEKKNAEIGVNETLWILYRIQNTPKMIHDSCSLPSQLHYHVRVDFLFAVDVGCGPSKLQQLVRLVHHQGGVELAQPEQVAAEHPAETARWGGAGEELRVKTSSRVTLELLFMCSPVYLSEVLRYVEEEAASLQHHQDQVG